MSTEILRWFAIALIAAAVIASGSFLLDMKRAYERVRGKTTVLASPYGDIEYAEQGSGPDVLIIHGSGGGFDQGELLGRAVLNDDFHWIIPSRFGYLNSTFHEDSTFDEQAHAYAHLLDQLGIDRVAVVAFSHGGPSALLFAALHPKRVSSLTLISCGVASSTTEDQAEANQKGDLLTAIYKRDVRYWAFTKIFRKQFMSLLGATSDVIDRLTPDQLDSVSNLIDYMNPVSLRADGVAFDNKAVLPGERIAAIQVPTLIVHAKDDTLQLYHNAEFAASHIPAAELVSYDSGGHLLIIIEQVEIQETVQEHILDHID